MKKKKNMSGVTAFGYGNVQVIFTVVSLFKHVSFVHLFFIVQCICEFVPGMCNTGAAAETA